jgi:hypothetical protein
MEALADRSPRADSPGVRTEYRVRHRLNPVDRLAVGVVPVVGFGADALAAPPELASGLCCEVRRAHPADDEARRALAGDGRAREYQRLNDRSDVLCEGWILAVGRGM